jgi:hypothetical protein
VADKWVFCIECGKNIPEADAHLVTVNELPVCNSRCAADYAARRAGVTLEEACVIGKCAHPHRAPD